MVKKLSIIILIVILLFSNVYAIELPLGYLPGDANYIVDNDDFQGGYGATKTTDGVQISAGGNAIYGFFVRFATRSASIKYEGIANLTINTEENTYNISLDGSGTYYLDFGVELGKEDQTYWYNQELSSGYSKEFVEKRGEKTLEITSDNNVLIKEIVFEKEKSPIQIRWKGVDDDGDGKYEEYVPITDNQGNIIDVTVEPNLSNEQKIFMSTIIMHEKANAIVVNGAYRYLSNDDIDTRPYNNDGTLYIPIETLSKALGYYFEDKPELGYALMRSDTHEIVMLGGGCTVSQGVNKEESIKGLEGVPDDVFLYSGGKTLAAVRFFAELTGKTVEYDNGLVVIDNKYSVNKILSNSELKNYAESQLSEFKKKSISNKTYHVAQHSGDDENNGSENSPFATISRAADIAKAGDTVIVHEGTYRETLKPANSGTANKPITFCAATDENVIISAAEEVYGWSDSSASELSINNTEEKIYKATIDWDMGVTQNQVFVDGVMQNEARYPNGPDSAFLGNAWPVKGDFTRLVGAANELKVQSSTLLWDQPDNYWKGGCYVGLFGYAYHLCTGIIESSVDGELTIGKERTTKWYSHQNNGFYNYGYIVGHKNALDVPGEWIKEGNVLYMIFPDGKAPESAKVEVKKRNLVVDLNGKSFVNVVGFDTFGGSIRMNNSNMCMVNGLDMKYISHFIHTADAITGYIDFDKNIVNKKKITETNTDVEGGIAEYVYEYYEYNKKDKDGAPERGVVGNYIGGSNNIFINNTIDHSAGAGIYLTGLYSYVDNNTMNDVGYMSTYVSGIYIGTRLYDSKTDTLRGGHAIYNNTVYNCGRSAFNVSSYDGAQAPYLPMDIAYNDFHDGMLASADTAITYEYFANMGYDGIMTKMHHNYVYLTTSASDFNPYSMAIYHDGASYGADTYNNKIFYTQAGSGYSVNTLFEQSAYWAVANFNHWDNTSIGYLPGGPSSLNKGYFVEEKPFFAGALKNSNYLTNYNRYADEMEYGMSSRTMSRGFEMSDSVVIDEKSGYADFVKDGEWVKFPLVFPNEANTIGLSVRGDSNHTHDEIEIYIDNLDGSPDYTTSVRIGAPELDIPEAMYVHIKETSGYHDVYIKAKDYRSVEIGGVGAYVLDGVRTGEDYAMFEYAGNFDEKGRMSGTGEASPKKEFRNPLGLGTAILDHSYYKDYVKYSNRNFSSPTEHLVICAGGTGTNLIQVCVDNIDNKVAEFTLRSQNFADRTPQLVKLDSVISAGNHDVYLKLFGGNSRINTIGFLKPTADLTKFECEKKRIYAGEFDTENSISGDSRFPLRAEYMNPPNYVYKGLSGTMSNSVVRYNDVTIPVGCTEFVINYSADKKYAGQKIEVRLDSLSNPPIASITTEGNGVNCFNQARTEIDSYDATKPHIVYLSFSNGDNTKANAKVEWFAFN